MPVLTAGIIDVFASSPLAGNPLAVVEDADGLDDALLKRIAGEFNQAETTFILRSERADRRLRSFTASGVEVFGAGHNALGAWLWLAQQGRLEPLESARTFTQEIGEEVLPVTLERRAGQIHGRMIQGQLKLLPPLAESHDLGRALGLASGDLLPHPPPRPADTGAAHLMVRLADKAAVDRAQPLAEALLAVLKPSGAEGCYVYAFDNASSERAYARFFNPTVGLWEDSATGTAAGPLAAYLAHEGLLPGGELVIEQGTRMGRPSFLHVRLTPAPELSGSGVIVFKGALTV